MMVNTYNELTLSKTLFSIMWVGLIESVEGLRLVSVERKLILPASCLQAQTATPLSL